MVPFLLFEVLIIERLVSSSNFIFALFYFDAKNQRLQVLQDGYWYLHALMFICRVVGRQEVDSRFDWFWVLSFFWRYSSHVYVNIQKLNQVLDEIVKNCIHWSFLLARFGVNKFDVRIGCCRSYDEKLLINIMLNTFLFILSVFFWEEER